MRKCTFYVCRSAIRWAERVVHAHLGECVGISLDRWVRVALQKCNRCHLSGQGESFTLGHSSPTRMVTIIQNVHHSRTSTSGPVSRCKSSFDNTCTILYEVSLHRQLCWVGVVALHFPFFIVAMVAALRAATLATSALVASSGPLAINENGTYSATVLLGTRAVKLLVDSERFGVWVSCRLFEDNQCDVGVSGYPTLNSVEYGRRTFPEVTIAGQVFKNLDVYVAYDPLNLADPSAQGYIGLDSGTLPDKPSAFAEGANVTSVALQLGTSAEDSKLSLNSIDWTLLQSKQTTTKTTVDARVSCVRLPVARSNTTVDDCTFTPRTSFASNYLASFDSTVPILKFEHSLLEKLEDRFLTTCTKVRSKGLAYPSSNDWVGYLCPASTQLPTLTIQMAAWEFYLDPVDYTAPANATTTSIGASGGGVSQIKVLIGGSRTSNSWVLGTPFLRKFPIMFNATKGLTMQYYNLFCTENTTCRAVPKRVIDTPSSGVGGGGRGGGAIDGDDGGHSGLVIVVRRKNHRTILTVGLSIGGVLLLAICGCICKCCMNDETEDEKEEKEGEVEVNGAAATTVNDGEGESGTHYGAAKSPRVV
jgi:hypothetical protein